MENHELETYDDKTCTDSSTGSTPNTPQFINPSSEISQLSGIFLKKSSHHMSIVHDYIYELFRYLSSYFIPHSYVVFVVLIKVHMFSQLFSYNFPDLLLWWLCDYKASQKTSWLTWLGTGQWIRPWPLIKNTVNWS